MPKTFWVMGSRLKLSGSLMMPFWIFIIIIGSSRLPACWALYSSILKVRPGCRDLGVVSHCDVHQFREFLRRLGLNGATEACRKDAAKSRARRYDAGFHNNA